MMILEINKEQQDRLYRPEMNGVKARAMMTYLNSIAVLVLVFLKA